MNYVKVLKLSLLQSIQLEMNRSIFDINNKMYKTFIPLNFLINL